MFVEASSRFAVELFRHLAAEYRDENLFFSPLSIFSVLAMALEGARGVTAEEIGSVLHLPDELRRRGTEDAGFPWDLGPLRAGYAKSCAWMSRGEECDRSKIAPRIIETRMRLYDLSKRAEDLRKRKEWRQLSEVEEENRTVQAEFERLSAQNAPKDPNEISVANALWGEKSCPFRGEFLEAIDTHYQKDGVFSVDFKEDSEGSKRSINDWVARQTHGRIQEILASGALNEWTRLILTNAVYLKGLWQKPFDAENTESRRFTRADGSTCDVRMMIAISMGSAKYAAFKADGSFFKTPSEVPRKAALDPVVAIMQEPVGRPWYPDRGGFALLELPYRGERLSMVLIAPNRHDGLPAIEKKLSAGTLTQWIAEQKARCVHVLLPTFKLDPDYRIATTLKKMGMIRAFEDPLGRYGAEFSGMSASDDPNHRLYIENLIHKTFVEVNETGTEAAAATAMVLPCRSARYEPKTVPFVPTFKADRPFLFLIRDRHSGTILFMGRVEDLEDVRRPE
jgi:serine protease inhibitor